MTRRAGRLKSISMASASRLKSSTTLKVRNRLPFQSASDMKSADQQAFTAALTAKGSGVAGWQPSLAAAALVEPQGTVHAIEPFVVPAVSLPANTLVKLGKPEFRVPVGEFQQHVNDWLVIPRMRGIAFHRDRMFLPDETHQFAFLVRPQSFFAMTSLRARFSSDTSA